MNTKQTVLSVSALEEKLNTNIATGLTTENATEKLREKPPLKAPAFWHFLLTQSADAFHILLIFAAAFLIWAGNGTWGILLLTFVLLRTAVLAVCLKKADAVRQKEHLFSLPFVSVLRDGNISTVAATDLAEGDVVLLKPKDTVCCTLQVVSEADFTACLPNGTEEKNPRLLNAGTAILTGNCACVVINAACEIPKAEKSPVQKRTENRIVISAAITFLVCALTIGFGICMRWEPDFCYKAAILYFLICPLDLFAAQKLCFSVSRLQTEKHGILKPAAASELCAATRIFVRETDLVSDKLTLRGIVTLYNAFDMHRPVPQAEKPVLKMIQEMALLCSNLTADEKGIYRGSREALAYLDCATRNGIFIETLQKKYPYLETAQTDTVQTACVQLPQGARTVICGNTNAVLPYCETVLGDKIVAPMTDAAKEALQQQFDAAVENGMFVCALAYSDHAGKKAHAQKDFTFLGLLCCSYVSNETGVSFVKACAANGLKPILVCRENEQKTNAVCALYGAEAACVSATAFTEEIAAHSAFCDADADAENKILNAYAARGIKTVVFAKDRLPDQPSIVPIATHQTNPMLFSRCAGFVSKGKEILPLKRIAENSLQKNAQITSVFCTFKLSVLLFALLCGCLLHTLPLTFLQVFWLSAVLLPLSLLCILSADERHTKPPQIRIALATALINGIVFMLCYGFGRYTIPAATPVLANAFGVTMAFNILTVGLMLILLQVLNRRILCTGGFLQNKKAFVLACMGVIGTLLLQYIPALRQAFDLVAMPFYKGFWLVPFALLLFVATDLVKYIEFLKQEKEKQNGREV